MFTAYLDASALVKRYLPEAGTAVINYLFTRLPPSRMFLLGVGVAEAVSVFVRRRNGGMISAATFSQAMNLFDREIVAPTRPLKLPVARSLVSTSLPLIQTHSINGNDAIFLRSALSLASKLRPGGDGLFLVASDLRLLRAARAEGLITFDPERQSQADLDAILGP
jgi:hypothetical protein